MLENAADAIGEVGKTGEYASAVCEYCEQVYHITLSGDPLRNERNLPEECNHQFRKLDYMLEQGWYPSYTATYEQDGVTYERVSIMHEYRTFYLCVCDYCDTTIRMYEGELTNGRSFENHNYPDLEDVEIHAHDYRNSRHLYFVTCEGDMLYDIGKTASNWVADKMQGVLEKVTDISGSFEFQNADLKGKIGMLWKGVVADPFKEWFDNLWSGEESIAKATDLGRNLAEKLTNGILAVLGITDIFGEGGLNEEAGANIAQGFAKGFVEGFDVSAITDKLAQAIGNVWGALPWWAKMLIGGYGVGKVAGGISNLAGGILKGIGAPAALGEGGTIVAGSGLRGLIGTRAITNAAGDVIGASGLLGALGSTGNAMVSGTGILGKLASAGYALTGGPASAGAYFGAGMSGAAAAGIGALGIGGGLAGGASLIKGGIDLYKAHKTDDEVEKKAYKTSGWSAISGVGAGAATGALLGSAIPVLGTAVGALVGAGVGGIAGWIGGNKSADRIRETDDAINDVSAATAKLETEQEKLEQRAKMVWQNMRDHFGDIKLSMTEIQSLAKKIVWGDDIASFEQFTTAAQTAEASLKTLKSASEDINRWMWKANLGVKFNEDETEAFVASIDEYVNSAISYAENKHYEFTAAVSLLVDAESENGKAILESGNAFYAGVQEQLSGLGAELAGKVEIALQDGVITLDEHAELINLQNQIAEITQKLSNAETEAELELIKIKFGTARLDADSFNALMEQMGTTLSERIAANDEAFKASVSSIKLQLAQEGLTEEQKAELNSQLETLTQGYHAKVGEIKAQVMNVELEIIGDAYADDGVTAEKLKSALEKSLTEGIDPIDWTTEQARTFLGIDKLSESSAGAIAEMLSSVAAQLSLLDSALPETVAATVGVNITGEVAIQNTIDVLVEDFGIPTEQAATVALLLAGDKQILSKIDTSKLAEELGVPESVAQEVITKLSGSKSIEERVNVLGTDLVDATEVWQTITVNLQSKVGQVIDKVSGFVSSVFGGGRTTSKTTSEYRGGIVGGDSAMEAFARGGETDNGGIVGGSTRFIRVNEESPEMIIPLSEQRRDRALNLWNKTGELLGVPGFARGGSTDGEQDEGIRFSTYRGGENAGGRTVQVNMGGIKLEINVNGSDKASVVEAIKAQAGELADYIVGQIADALEIEFENTPVRGGIA